MHTDKNNLGDAPKLDHRRCFGRAPEGGSRARHAKFREGGCEIA